MAGNRRTRRSTSVEPANSQQPVIRRSLRTRQDSNKENTPPKNSNTQIEENANEKVTTAQQEVCGICLDTVNVDKGGLPVCVHTFCFDCIHQWSKTSNTCPMCKAKFKMINRTESLTSKPKRVKVSDVDQRPDYSDPDPDDFLSDEEDSGDDLIYFGEDILLDLVGDAWMDIDDGEFLETDDDDEEDDGLEAELIDEDELAEAEESEDEDEANSWESHLANANTYDRGEEGQDSDYESDDCIIIDAPASRTRARGSRASSRSSNNVIMINIHDSDDDEEDEDGDDESEDGVGLRRSRRLQNSRQRRVTTLVLNFDELSDASNDFGSSESDELEGEEEIQEEEEGEGEEEEHEQEEEEEVRRTITTRSRSYPSAFSANNDIVTPRVTRSSSRTRDRASSDIINEITPPRLTRSQSRNRSFNNNNNNNTPVTRTRRRRVHSNNHIEEEDEDDERKGKRVRKSPSRFGFDYGTKESPATPTTTTTTTTTTTSTWRDTPEDEDETMEGESRYNLRRSRRNM